MITREEILKEQACPPELEANLSELLVALNKFRSVYAIPMNVSSGYRNAEHNRAIGGSANSAHLYCQAADFQDRDRSLTRFCITHLDLLEECGLWMEDPNATPSWLHLQTRPAKNRIFKP